MAPQSYITNMLDELKTRVAALKALPDYSPTADGFTAGQVDYLLALIEDLSADRRLLLDQIRKVWELTK